MLSRLLSGAAPTVGGAFVVTLAATICGLALGIFAGSTHGLRSAVLTTFWIRCCRSCPCCWQSLLLFCRSAPVACHVRRLFCPASCARFTAWCMMSWKKSTSSPRVWTARQPSTFCGLPYCPTSPPGWSSRSPALSMAILDIAALGFLDLGAQPPSPEWGAMLGDALELIHCGTVDGHAAGCGHYGKRAAYQPAGRRYSPCN